MSSGTLPTIKTFRRRRELTQRQLAERVGTDVHHIARLEAGAQSCRLPMAKALAAALEVDLAKLFPAAARKLRGLGERPADDAQITSFEDLGIDIDPAKWMARIVLRSGEELLLPISGADRVYLGKAVQRLDARTSPFVKFTSIDKKVLLNLEHVLLCQFLFEAYELELDAPDYDDGHKLEVRFAGVPRVFEFQVELDELEDDGLGQIGGIFFTAELRIDPEPFSAGFIDVDGEYAVLRMEDVAMLSVPVPVVAPDAETEYEEDERVPDLTLVRPSGE